MKRRTLFFFVPAGLLIGLGIWIIGFNIVNYFHGIENIENSKQTCDGIPCVCNNFGCVTKEDLTRSYAGYFGWGIGFVSLGVLILVFSRRWCK